MVQYQFRNGAFLQNDDKVGTHLIGSVVRDIGNAFDGLVVDKIGDLFGKVSLIDHIRKLSKDNLSMAGFFFCVIFGADFDRSSSSFEVFFDSLSA